MLFSMVLTFSPLNWKLFLQETGSKPWFLLCFAASFTTFVMLILRETGSKPWFLPCFQTISPLFSHHYWRNLDALAKNYQKHRVFHRLVLILTLITWNEVENCKHCDVVVILPLFLWLLLVFHWYPSWHVFVWALAVAARQYPSKKNKPDSGLFFLHCLSITP